MARAKENYQLTFNQIPIEDVSFNLYSRDQMPKLLKGLQVIYKDIDCFNKITNLILRDISKNSNTKNKKLGAPSMPAWAIFVLLSVHQNGRYDYDQLAELASNHVNLREMLGLSIDDRRPIARSTLHDNLKLLDPETVQEIMEIVLKNGHKLLNVKKKDLELVADTFVYETNIHFHTDYGSIFDGIRCLLRDGKKLASTLNFLGYRKQNDIEKKVKKYCREIGTINKSRSNDKEEEIKDKFIKIVRLMEIVFKKTYEVIDKSKNIIIDDKRIVRKVNKLRENIFHYLVLTSYEANLAKRRILGEEKIETCEKIFSLFEEHTEMICKGKAKAPMEFGHRVLVVQDQFGFVLTCKRPGIGLVDEKIITKEIKRTRQVFGKIKSLSLDKGFWSVENHTELSKEVDLLVLPNKGKQKKYEAQTKEYKNIRRKHSRVESCINALESGNNLHICRDKGLDGFDMSVACAGLARNLHVIGHHQLEKEKRICVKTLQKSS